MDFDVVVVGAGSAGGVLAARLSEDPTRSVLLVEAGPDFGSSPEGQPPAVRDASDVTATDHDWGLQAEFAALGRRSPVYAGRLLGGSSATNNVMALRGQPGDYDAWAAAGNPGWSYADVLPAFTRLECDRDFGDEAGHGHDGPIRIGRCPQAELAPHQRAFLCACLAAGHPAVADHNAPGAAGAGPLPLNAVDGVRQSTALTYLAAARGRTNLTIRPDTLVDRIPLDNGRAVGVQLAQSGEAITADRVILAAGAYGSPTLLLRSGIGPGEHLRELGIPVHCDLPGVGANLHDHPLLRLRFAARGQPRPLPCQALLTFSSTPPQAAPDLQIFPSGIVGGETGPELILIVALLQPQSRGQLRLQAPDPGTAPHIDVGLLRHTDDLSKLLAGTRQARHISATPPLAEHLDTELWPGPDTVTDEQLADAIRAGINVYQHPVGTCRMGPATDPNAVVDSTGRVHGVDRLHVIDASIMPAIPAANTNLSTLMLAEHLTHQ